MSSENMNQEQNEPMEGTPASGQNDEASRGESLPPQQTIRPHDLVQLRFALAEHGLAAGTTGAVVHAYHNQQTDIRAYEVEFSGGLVITLEAMQVELATAPVAQPPLPDTRKPETMPPHAAWLEAPKPGRPKKPKKRTKSEEMCDAAQEVLDAIEEAREKVNAMEEALNEARDELEAAIEAVGEKMENLRSLREDLYQGWYDNMNEGLQQSPTGEKLRALLEDIDLEPSMPEVPELEEISFDDVESAAQQIMEAEFPQGFGRD